MATLIIVVCQFAGDLNNIGMEGQSTQRCDNCLKEFPDSKIASHFGYCRRNIKRCPTCNELFDINFKEEHEEEYHKQATCEYCKKNFKISDYQLHQGRCDMKPKYCEYCDLNVPVATYPGHLKDCESRTKPCTKCNKPITNKEYLIHLVSCTGPKQETKESKLPKNYYEYIEEKRRPEPKVIVPQPANSREKKPPSYEQKPREEKQYAFIRNDRNDPKANYYQPRPQPRGEQKRQVPSYPTRLQPKREEIRRPTNPASIPVPVPLPPPTFSYNSSKPQNSRPVNKYPPTSQLNQPISQPSNYIRGTNSREPIKQILPGSYKDLGYQPGSREPAVKEAKSIEKFNGLQKKEERPERPPEVPSNGHKRIFAQEPNQRVIYNSSLREQQKGQREMVTPSDYLQEQYAMGSLSLNGQDPELQLAIMQSLGQGGKGGGYTFDESNPSPSMIEEQRKIEQELKRNRRR